jgi:hypothetical protein
MSNPDSFHSMLPADSRSSEIPAADDFYGWFVGAWELDLEIHDREGNIHKSKGEAHASWVLEGRAIQDIFINPRCADRGTNVPRVDSNWFGSTFRMYDRATRSWRITWLNPVNCTGAELVARRRGGDIVQEGKYSDGGTIRWTFSEITSDTFRWLGERLKPDGKTWFTQVEFRGRRHPAKG